MLSNESSVVTTLISRAGELKSIEAECANKMGYIFVFKKSLCKKKIRGGGIFDRLKPIRDRSLILILIYTWLAKLKYDPNHSSFRDFFYYVKLCILF